MGETTVAREWMRCLKKEGYQHTCKTNKEFKRLRRLPRVWKRILSMIDLERGSSCFEVGCGGGMHLVRLTLNGFLVEGIDCAIDEVKRAQKFIKQVADFDNRVSQIRIYNGDFLSNNCEALIAKKYDLVFDFGVAEHFLERSERLEFIKRKFRLTKKGGWVVSVVPSGKHPYRTIQRSQGLGGYNLPEIDYSPELLKAEILHCGGTGAFILAHNLMGYLNIHPKRRIPERGIYYLFQAVPQSLFGKRFLTKHAFSYIAIAKK